MESSLLEYVVVVCGLALLGLGLLSLRGSARRSRRQKALAHISQDEILAVQRQAEGAAHEFRDSGFVTCTPNPHAVGTRARIIWETTFHSVSMD